MDSRIPLLRKLMQECPSMLVDFLNPENPGHIELSYPELVALAPDDIKALYARVSLLEHFLFNYARFDIFRQNRGVIAWEPNPVREDPFNRADTSIIFDPENPDSLNRHISSALPNMESINHDGSVYKRGLQRATLVRRDDSGKSLQQFVVYHDMRGRRERYIVMDKGIDYSPFDPRICIIEIDRSQSPPIISSRAASGPVITDNMAMRDIQLLALQNYQASLKDALFSSFREMRHDLICEGRTKKSYDTKLDAWINYTMGSGKTFIYWYLTLALGGRSVMVAPSDELAMQIAREGNFVLPDAEVTLSSDFRNFLLGKETGHQSELAIGRLQGYIVENDYDLEHIRRDFRNQIAPPADIIGVFLTPKDPLSSHVSVVSATDLLYFAPYLQKNPLFLDELHMFAEDDRYVLRRKGKQSIHVLEWLRDSNDMLSATGSPTPGVRQYLGEEPIAEVNQHMMVYTKGLTRQISYHVYRVKTDGMDDRTELPPVNRKQLLANILISQFGARHYCQPGQACYVGEPEVSQSDTAVVSMMEQNRIDYMAYKGIVFSDISSGIPAPAEIAEAFNAVFEGNDVRFKELTGYDLDSLAFVVRKMRFRHFVAEYLWRHDSLYTDMDYGFEKEQVRLKAEDIEFDGQDIYVRGKSLKLLLRGDAHQSFLLKEYAQEPALTGEALRAELEAGFRQQVADHITDRVVASLENIPIKNVRRIRVEERQLPDYLNHLSHDLVKYREGKYRGDQRNINILNSINEMNEDKLKFDAGAGVSGVTLYARLYHALDGLLPDSRRYVLDELIRGDIGRLIIEADQVDLSNGFSAGGVRAMFAVVIREESANRQALLEAFRDGRIGWCCADGSLATGFSDEELRKGVHINLSIPEDPSLDTQAFCRTNRALDHIPAFETTFVPDCYDLNAEPGQRPLRNEDILSPDFSKRMAQYAKNVSGLAPQKNNNRPALPEPIIVEERRFFPKSNKG